MVILLNKLGYIENYGTGIQRILEAYQGAEHQPEFYVSKSYFMVSLYSLNPIDTFDARNEAQFDAQNEAQKPSIYEGIIHLIKQIPESRENKWQQKSGYLKQP